ncbi:MAG: DUF1631 domain-containing protein [Zoogloea sp.]|jgi:hypothetical protein|nr:DUF1631 domain-containing protein [Zoogloea sp.]
MPHRPRASDQAAEQAVRLLARAREGFLKALLEGAGEVIRHRDWQDVLSAAAGACFDELVGGRRAPKPAEGARPINLVRSDESDYSIGLINLDRRLQEFCGRELATLHLRLRLQLAEGGIQLHEESPLGTATVCRALRVLKEVEKLSPSQALQLLLRLETPVGQRLSRFYRDLEHELADEALALRGQQTRGLLAPIGSAVEAEEEWTDTPAARASLPIDPVDALRLASLAQREAEPTRVSSVDPGLASALVERIEAWLIERQRFGTGVPTALGASELGALLSPAQAVAVEVVETVCNRAESDADLPPTIRTLLGGLRVPLLRLALRSQKLLSIERHPAFRLVDRIANLGRTLPSDCTAELPVCRGLASMVRSLGRLPQPTRRDFELALGVLDTLLTTRQKSAIARAAQHIDTAIRLERREVALHQASRAVYLLVGQEPASVARNFLERYWVHVLAKAVYLYGPDSPQWASRLLIANRLLACASPPDDEALRRKMLGEFPALIHDLDEGLTWIALPAKQAGSALSSVQALHASLLAGRTPPVPTLRRSTSPPTLKKPEGSHGLLTLKHKQYVAGELSLPPEWAVLKVGDSVAVGLPNGKVMRGYVAHIAPAGQVVLISDGDHDAVMAITARALAQQTESPETRLFSDISLVDQAATDKLLGP